MSTIISLHYTCLQIAQNLDFLKFLFHKLSILRYCMLEAFFGAKTKTFEMVGFKRMGALAVALSIKGR